MQKHEKLNWLAVRQRVDIKNLSWSMRNNYRVFGFVYIRERKKKTNRTVKQRERDRCKCKQKQKDRESKRVLAKYENLSIRNEASEGTFFTFSLLVDYLQRSLTMLSWVNSQCSYIIYACLKLVAQCMLQV